MNDLEEAKLESELRRIHPAQPPRVFMAKLVASRPGQPPRREPSTVRVNRVSNWDLVMRWLFPATALLVFSVFCWRLGFVPASGPTRLRNPAATAAALKADDVQIAHELVSSFDAVARLPSGEPVRFRCRQWMDQVVFSDKDRGIAVEERRPRVEVIPVRFETY